MTIRLRTATLDRQLPPNWTEAAGSRHSLIRRQRGDFPRITRSQSNGGVSGAETPPVRQNRLTGGGEPRSRRSRHTPVACAYLRPARCRAMAQIVRPSRCAHTTTASPPRPRHSASIAVGAARQPPSIGNGRGSRSPLKAWPGKRRWQRVDLRAALSVATEVNFVPLADDLTRRAPTADGLLTSSVSKLHHLSPTG